MRGKALNVEQRYKRAANFQQRTLQAAFDLIGAMGLDDPDQLTPNLIWRRGADETNQHFSEIYPMLVDNELLGEDIHTDYASEWKLASGETFAPKLHP